MPSFSLARPAPRIAAPLLCSLLLAGCGGGGGGGGGNNPPPALTVTLAATSTHVSTAGSITLTATPAGGTAIQKVEFFEGATALATDTASPFTLDVAYTAASIGTHAYHAVVTDGVAGTATSATVSVLVDIPAPPGYHVAIATGLDTNPCSAALPCKSIRHTVTGAPAGTVVEIDDGTYDVANEAGGFELPNGVRLHAVHPRLTILSGLSITTLGSAAFEDVVLDGGMVDATLGAGAPTLTLTGVALRPSGSLELVRVGGSVQATCTPGTLPGGVYTDLTPRAGDLFGVQDAASLTVTGGAFTADATGARAFTVRGAAHLVLDAVTIKDRVSTAIYAGGGNGQTVDVLLRNGTQLQGNGGQPFFGEQAVLLAANAHLVVDASTISGTHGAAIAVPENDVPGNAASLVNGAALTGNTYGILTKGGLSPASPFAITLDHATVTGNTEIGIQRRGGGALTVTASTVTGSPYGIVALNGAALKVRDTNLAGNAVGVRVVDAASVDLGTAGSAGGNHLDACATTGLQVQTNVATPPTIDAVGDTWSAGVQGADGAGKYAAGTTVVAPDGGALGANYQLLVTGGTLGKGTTLHL